MVTINGGGYGISTEGAKIVGGGNGILPTTTSSYSKPNSTTYALYTLTENVNIDFFILTIYPFQICDTSSSTNYSLAASSVSPMSQILFANSSTQDIVGYYYNNFYNDGARNSFADYSFVYNHDSKTFTIKTIGATS
jgi:hypothetical protein